jgi:Zn-dependent peptidase ImmA (M78 family)
MARISVPAAARELFEQLSLSVPVSAVAVARELGLHVDYLPLKSISGIMIPSEELILVSTRQRNGRRNFTVAHEVGHYILHIEKNSCFACIMDMHIRLPLEREANLFAAELLMPADSVKSLAADMCVRRMASYFRVSNQAMEIRIKELGLASLVVS